MPAKAVLDKTVFLWKNKTNIWGIQGFAESTTTLVVHDGRKDFFASMPLYVTQPYKDTRHIRTLIGQERNCTSKIVAVVLNNYTVKPPGHFDIFERKLRNGYGTASISKAPPEFTAEDVVNFFGKSLQPGMPSQSQSDGGFADALASSPPDLPPSEHDDQGNDSANENQSEEFEEMPPAASHQQGEDQPDHPDQTDPVASGLDGSPAIPAVEVATRPY